MLRLSGKFVREYFKFEIVTRRFSGNNKIVVNEEVRSALNQNKPVVALESTIITHGMPYPQNINCALEVEEVVRAQGAVPATIAIIKGEVKVGLSQKELDELGDVQKSSPIKTSRRDLAFVVSNRLNGGTTVSGTIIVASKVGIPIFATGGVGGVHREGETTLDVSADLPELGCSSVAVVSSGVKSILDIPKTLEYLETQGVFVATFGDTADFPAFYCRKSGFQVPYRVQTARQAAEIIHANHELNMQSGMLFAVPVPQEFALDEKLVDGVVEEALKTAKREGISGKRITPFLLAKIAEITAGKSLETNMALIKNNAKTAARIACELSRLKAGKATTFPNEGPVVIGGSNLDCSIKLADPALKMDGRIHPAKHFLSAGGVGRNICEALSKLGLPPSVFISALGDDQPGRILRPSIPPRTLGQVAILPEAHTAQCTAIFDLKGDLYFLLGDMDIHSKITPEMIRAKEDVIKKAPLIIFDANLTLPTIATILELAHVYNVPVFFEPTDVVISTKPFETDHWRAIKFISPNLNEIRHIARELKIPFFENSQNKIAEAADIAGKLADYVENVFVTLGDDGLVIARRGDATEPLLSKSLKRSSGVKVRHYPVKKIEECVNVSGAGDSLASGLVVAMMVGLSEERCVSVGFAAAQTALFSSAAVAPTIFGRDHKSWLEVAKYNTLV